MAIDPELRNYPSRWWVLWLQRAIIIIPGVWGLVLGQRGPLMISGIFLLLHVWFVRRVRREKAERDAYFANMMSHYERNHE